MGWNAGGFGQMSFPGEPAVAAWRSSSVRHADWEDWVDHLAVSRGQVLVVDEQLAAYARAHDPARQGIYAIEIAGIQVELVFDAEADDFRGAVGDLAALLRAAAPHGATGTFHFLGTAGAEYAFVYRLELANLRSTVTALPEPEIAATYEGEAFSRFMERTLAMLEQADPATQQLMQSARRTTK